jgi:chromosome segregation ATPase
MQQSPHDEGFRWLLTILALPFAGGVGWLVRRLLGRKTELVQLGLTEAQTEAQRATVEEIRARVRREDGDSLIGNLKVVSQELRADVERLRHEREEQRARADAAETRIAQLLEEQKARHKMVNELNAYKLREGLMKMGMSFEEAYRQPIEPIYPEAEG